MVILTCQRTWSLFVIISICQITIIIIALTMIRTSAKSMFIPSMTEWLFYRDTIPVSSLTVF